MKSKLVYQTIASLVQARLNCIQAENHEWLFKHTSRIEAIADLHLPSGSGIDCGTKIDLDESTSEKLVLNLSYHHMDDWGSYDGWTDHQIIVTPSLAFGFNLRVTGKNRNDIKEYLHEVYSCALGEVYEPEAVSA